MAPIVLFVYNRPLHTRRTLEALKANEGAEASELFVFADGPKEGANEECLQKIKETREVVRSDSWCAKVTLIESSVNKGLAKSIIEGVTEIVNQYGSVIVLEDDLETSPFFLTYMNEALEVYKDNQSVACIHGYVEPHKKALPETFFIKGADCWGWATWKRAWDKFNPDGKALLKELVERKCQKHFNFNNSYDYIKMLQDQIAGRNNSWAIRWLASAYLNDMYCLYPNETLVINTGFDGTGTHCGTAKVEPRMLCNHRINVTYTEPKECKEAWLSYARYYSSRKPSFITRVKRKIKKVLKCA